MEVVLITGTVRLVRDVITMSDVCLCLIRYQLTQLVRENSHYTSLSLVLIICK